MSRAIADSSILHMLPAYLERIGVDPSSIFRQAGMGPQHMVSPVVVRRAQIHAALGLAARAAGQAEIGLSLGRLAEPAKLGPAGLAILAGQSLEMCLRGHMALMPRLQSDCGQRLWVEGQSAIYSHHLIGDDHSAWLLYEGAMAFNLQVMRQFLGEAWAAELITFPHACRGRRSVYEAYFGGPVIFGIHSEARIYFPKDLLKISRKNFAVVQPANEKAEALPVDPFCLMRMERFDLEGRQLVDALSNIINASLPHTTVTLSGATARLGLSERTLQRRLAESGWTFKTLVDRQRCALSRQRLADVTQSITDVAMSVGYSDTAHFNRAFRRWENCSPSDYRRKLINAGPGASAG